MRHFHALGTKFQVCPFASRLNQGRDTIVRLSDLDMSYRILSQLLNAQKVYVFHPTPQQNDAWAVSLAR